MKRLKSKQGFTLIEVVVVMAIIAVLAVLIIGAIAIARRAAIETANRASARSLQTCFEAYFSRNRAYCGVGTTTCATGTIAVKRGQLATDLGSCAVTAGTSADEGGSVTALPVGGASYTIIANNWDGDGTLETFSSQ